MVMEDTLTVSDLEKLREDLNKAFGEAAIAADETVAAEVAPEDVIAAITAPAPKAPERCTSTSPDGLVQCELEEHGEAIPHQFVIQTINGPFLRYW